MRLRLSHAAPLLVLLAPLASADAKGPDPAERGIDLFVHAVPTAMSGDAVSIALEAYGFPTVTDPRPLPGATIVAAWDPESLGPHVSSAPPDVSVVTDGRGRARLTVPVPPGDPRKLTLLVAARHGEHGRTRKLEIARTERLHVDVRTPDPAVVPGSQIPVFLTLSDARTDAPIAATVADVGLFEGDVERSTNRVVTDASGVARTSFLVPSGATGQPPLSIRARLVASGASASTTLRLREETPATPKLLTRWVELQLKPGEIGHAKVRVLDATDEPIAGHEVTWWVGPKGTTPPTTDEEWAKSATKGRTDGMGELSFQAQAPRVVGAHGSDLAFVVRTEIEGQKLEQTWHLPVDQPAASASIDPEGGALVPGATQRIFLHVSDGEHGVGGEFVVKGDGLDARVTTDAHGDAALSWTVPEDIGAARQVGPCAGGVAASVVVRQAHDLPALARHKEPFELCASVARDRTALLRPTVDVARVGDKVRLSLEGGKRVARDPASLVVRAGAGFGLATWAEAQGAEVDLASAVPGVHEVTAVTPRPSSASQIAAARLLVVPKVLPKLEAKLAGGRLAPGGEAVVEVQLRDERGAPIVGVVSAVAIDKEGGGSVAGVEHLDTRLALCAQAHVLRERCDDFLEGKPGVEVLRQRALSTAPDAGTAPLLDPGANAKADLKRTFSDVLHSLEGAVYQSQTPESLRDVRRKEGGRWVFNPELMTLVTSAMKDAPTTPGGEAFALGDLIAVDPQVTFDAVARRVTRLKLFNVLAAMRSHREGELLDGDEPVFKDPPAILRRMVRDNKLAAESLLDPWGGTIQLVRTNAPPTPFLTVARGWELRSPGPDGRIDTADDVRDPFERVVRSGTPYALAMGEDEIVDARWDMRVGDATVQAWQQMFDRLTGTALGLSGVGEGGGGQGYGSGHGRLGGSHATREPQVRFGRGIETEAVRWTDPVRTDDKGRATLRVRLGDAETTWRIAAVARSDAGQSAVATVDAPAFLPLSARVDLGRKLTVGDEIGGRVVVRNRTGSPRAVTLDLSAEGGLALAKDQPKVASVEVPPNAVRSIFARFVAKAEGRGVAHVGLRAAGSDGDRATQETTIEPAGEPRVLLTGAFASGRRTLRVEMPPSHEPRGEARLVLESGVEDAVLAALGSIDADPSTPPEALADLIEIAARVERMAEVDGKHWLVARARHTAALARSYLDEHKVDSPRGRVALARAQIHARPAPAPKRTPEPAPACPKDADLDGAPIALFLETEPAPPPNGPLACFTSLTAKLDAKSPLEIARAVLAMSERPHRAPLVSTLGRDLARATRADALAEPVFDGSRGDRAIVLAALARSASAWTTDRGAATRLAQRALSLRDARGSYGSSEATRDVVRLLVALEPELSRPARVTVGEGGARRVIELPKNGAASVPLGRGATEVTLDVAGGAVLARLERPTLRRFGPAPEGLVTPVSVSVEWPNEPRAGTTGVLHVTYKVALGRRAQVWTRLPLPPGVELAAPTPKVATRQGVLHVRAALDVEETLSIPIRFTLPGVVTVPEAETKTTSEEQPRTLTPARTLKVRP